MVLFGLAAFVLGWAAIVPLARALLSRRISPQKRRKALPGQAVPFPCTPPRRASTASSPHHTVPRLASASALSLSALLVWNAERTPLGGCALIAGASCLLVACCCDCRARIIPWETCAALLVSGCAFALAELGAQALLFSLIASGICIGMLGLARLVARRRKRPCPVGAGDLRLLPGLFAFGTLYDSLCGAFCCSLFMAAWALGALALARARKTAVPAALPMAPGFFLWFLASTLGTVI